MLGTCSTFWRKTMGLNWSFRMRRKSSKRGRRLRGRGRILSQGRKGSLRLRVWGENLLSQLRRRESGRRVTLIRDTRMNISKTNEHKDMVRIVYFKKWGFEWAPYEFIICYEFFLQINKKLTYLFIKINNLYVTIIQKKFFFLSMLIKIPTRTKNTIINMKSTQSLFVFLYLSKVSFSAEFLLIKLILAFSALLFNFSIIFF